MAIRAADIVELTREITVAATVAVNNRDYLRLGIADAVLLTLANDDRLTLVSDDLELCRAAQRADLHSINFNYLRDGALRLDQL